MCDNLNNEGRERFKKMTKEKKRKRDNLDAGEKSGLKKMKRKGKKKKVTTSLIKKIS